MIPTNALLRSAISGIALLAANPALAQGGEPLSADIIPGDPSEDETDAIVVVADRLRGQVDGPQPPILELDEEQIAGYGASSIAELVQALSAQTSSGSARSSGPPAFLVNGMRISSFREMRSYPPEAIQKVEILPEDVSLRYGFSANQRVINFILKDGFSSRTVDLEYGQPWAGGNSTKEVQLTYLRIDGPSRLNLNAEWNDTSMLTEADRDLLQAPGSIPGLPGDPDPARYRSLISDSSDVELTANWSTRLSDSGASLSLNSTYEYTDSLSLSGLNTVLLTDPDNNSLLRSFGEDSPLEQRRRTSVLSAGTTLNAPLGDWQLTGTLDAGRTITKTEIDRFADVSALIEAAADGSLAIDGPLPPVTNPGFDEARTATSQASSLVTVMGSPLWLPAGQTTLTLSTGYRWNRIESSDTRNPGIESSLTRGDISGAVNLGIPIASRREDVLPWLGDFTLNFTGGINHLSDFGTLTDWTAGFTWGVTETLNLQASYIARDAAPSLNQLSAPEIVTLNVPIYDLSRGETVLATVTSGGNPDLEKQKQRDIRLAAMWQLPFQQGSNFMIEYFNNRSEDVSASFPLLTPSIEAAFPERVTRDNSGRLVSIDQRPVTFAEQNSSRLRFSLNVSGQLGSARPDADAPRGLFGMARDAGAAQGGARGPGASEAGQQEGRDPARFAELRQRLCIDGETPDIASMPEQMRAQLLGDDGQIDSEKLEQFKSRICSSDGPQLARGAGQGGAQSGPPQQGTGGPRMGGGRGGGGFRGPGGDGRGRWFANLGYTLELENEVRIAENLPVLNLLDGGALSGGGVSRHSADLNGGMFYRGFGTRLSARYSGPSRIDGTGLPGSTDLSFGSLTTVDWRIFVDLGQQESLVSSVPFLRGSRISFSVDNVFDSYRTVTDATGNVPLRYQRGFLNPEGRKFEIDFRKMF